MVTVDNTPETASRTAASESPKRAVRPRSKVACRQCRRRKVRCDVYPYGAPCTNCRLDNIDCGLCEKIRRPRRNEHNASQQDIVGGVASPFDLHLLAGQHSSVHNGEGRITSDELERSSIHTRARWRNDQSPTSARPSLSVPPRGSLATVDMEYTSGRAPRTRYLNDLPSFVHCDFHHLPDEKLSCLAAKGCFTLPTETVLHELLKCYFDFIHPHLPVIDEEEFWDKYLGQNRQFLRFNPLDGGSISLLLFQAVLFAASTCASLSVLQKAGYNSRKVARRIIFSRVHALYSLEVERDPIVVVQSLLLMSYWRGGSDSYENAWHWSGLAVKLVTSIDLQGERNTTLSERQKALRRRCWWSCVLRDRLVAFSEQCSPRIQLDNCDVPMLTLADYNVGLRSRPSELSAEEELGKRTALSLFSIQLIRLVLCLRDGRSLTGDLDSSSLAVEETWARTQPDPSESAPRSGLSDLDSWTLNLPEVLQYPSDCVGDDTILPCILAHRNYLHIYYHKVVLSVYAPRLLIATSPSERNPDSDVVRQSSLALAKLHDELVDCDLIHCVPSDCFGSITHAQRVLPELAIGCEQIRHDHTNLANVYTIIMKETRSVRHATTGAMAIITQGMSDSVTMDNLVKNNTGSLKNGRPPDCINIEEPDRELGTEDLNEPEIDMIEYGSWIIDNVEDSGDSSPNFPSLSANGSSVVTSELDMLVSSPQLDFGDLLCTEVLEAVEG